MERFRYMQSVTKRVISTVKFFSTFNGNPNLLRVDKRRNVANLCTESSIKFDIKQYSSFHNFNPFLCSVKECRLVKDQKRHKYKGKLTKREKILRDQNTPIADVHGRTRNHDNGFDISLSPEENASVVFEKLLKANHVSKRELSLRDLIQGFIETQCDKTDIEWIFENHADLMRRHDTNDWLELVQCLQNCGFFGSNILHITAKNPLLFRVSKDDIVRTTLVLRQVFETETRMCRVCLKQPHLLTLPSEQLQEQYSELSVIFAKKDLIGLLNRNPNLLIDAIDETQIKVEYVMDTLNVPEKQVMGTRLFSHSIQHIIKRSEFLMKSGLYVRPDKHGHSPVYNASLKDIVDTSDSVFSHKVAHCSPDEYEAFCSMFDKYDERSVEIESDGENDYDFDE